MNEALSSMLSRYSCTSARDYENALKEIIQEIALLGLWRSKFFEHAAFYGGTALRILYGLDRFSEDLDFSLLRPATSFSLSSYNQAVQDELTAFGFEVTVESKNKSRHSTIQSAFIKADTKTELLKIRTPAGIAESVHRGRLLKIKFELDINPPCGFEVETKSVFSPIPFSVLTFQRPDLFAGKIHAVLVRGWQQRVKGRDWYDLLWYLGQKTPVRLAHLEARLKQSEKLEISTNLNQETLVVMLKDRIAAVDFDSAKKDVLPFVRDPASVAGWSKALFTDALERLTSV